MKYQQIPHQIRRRMFDSNLNRWLDGIGAMISSHLSVFYFSLAAGHQHSFDHTSTRIGYNMFEFIGFAYLIMLMCFALLLCAGMFRQAILHIIIRPFLLGLIVIEMLRVRLVLSEDWPPWIQGFSEGLVWFSRISLFLTPIVLVLVILFVNSVLSFLYPDKRRR